MKKKKVVLAYSGGLDTSYCLLHLSKLGFEVHAYHVNTGGFTDEEVRQLHKRALTMGVDHFVTHNNEIEYYEKCLRYLIFGNILRNRTYPLSVSSERVFQAKAVLRYAKQIQADYIAHGSTGAGNDQIRFDGVFETLAPEIKIITPIRDQKLSRQQEIDYIRAAGYDWNEASKEYSINQGLWGTSVGGKETLTSHKGLPDKAFPHPCTTQEPQKLTISFRSGEPVAMNGNTYDSPVELIRELNEIGYSYAIGRDIHVGDTIIGIKGRVGFEAPGALILIKAHDLLEKHTLGKWQMYWKGQLADWYGMFLHEGKYFDPVMRNIETFLSDSQETVTGKVHLTLHPYRFTLEGVESDKDLMRSDFGQYGEMNKAWSGEDVKGFTKVFSLADKIYYNVNQPENL